MIQNNMYANNINARKNINHETACTNIDLLACTNNPSRGLSIDFFIISPVFFDELGLGILLSSPIQVPQYGHALSYFFILQYGHFIVNKNSLKLINSELSLISIYSG